MYRRSDRKVTCISGIRKVMARQHVDPDGSLTRFRTFPFDRSHDLAWWGHDPEEPDHVPLRYFQDVYHSKGIP